MVIEIVTRNYNTLKNWYIANSLHYWTTRFESAYKPIIDSTEKVVELLEFIRYEQREYLVCIALDATNKVIARRVISIGTLTASLIHPREVFREAIKDGAVSVIVGHNHPSGSKPSTEDVAITARLKESGKILGIELIDHLIITPSSYTSIL